MWKTKNLSLVIAMAATTQFSQKVDSRGSQMTDSIILSLADYGLDDRGSSPDRGRGFFF
jgi:hypothetical protein